MTRDGHQGHLATLTTPEENAYIYSIFGSLGWSARGAWLGGYQANDAIVPAGSWNWVTDDGWDWTAWHSNEPNDGDSYPLAVEDGEQNYLGFNSSYDSATWGDHAGTELRRYIVEYDTNPVPIPAAVWLLGSGLIGLVGFRRKLQG